MSVICKKKKKKKNTTLFKKMLLTLLEFLQGSIYVYINKMLPEGQIK